MYAKCCQLPRRCRLRPDDMHRYNYPSFSVINYFVLCLIVVVIILWRMKLCAVRFCASANIADEFRSTPGTVIIFSVWHHEAVLSNTFLGEVVLPLCDLRELSAVQTVDDLPAVMMPLRRPKEPRDGPYKVCQSLPQTLAVLLNAVFFCDEKKFGLEGIKS